MVAFACCLYRDGSGRPVLDGAGSRWAGLAVLAGGSGAVMEVDDGSVTGPDGLLQRLGVVTDCAHRD